MVISMISGIKRSLDTSLPRMDRRTASASINTLMALENLREGRISFKESIISRVASVGNVFRARSTDLFVLSQGMRPVQIYYQIEDCLRTLSGKNISSDQALAFIKDHCGIDDDVCDSVSSENISRERAHLGLRYVIVFAAKIHPRGGSVSPGHVIDTSKLQQSTTIDEVISSYQRATFRDADEVTETIRIRPGLY